MPFSNNLSDIFKMKFLIMSLIAIISVSDANDKVRRFDDSFETLKVSKHLFWENIGTVSDKNCLFSCELFELRFLFGI